MKINNRFKCGDTVYVLNDGSIKEATVTSIQVNITSTKTTIHYTLDGRWLLIKNFLDNIFIEYSVFKSKEELKKSL